MRIATNIEWDTSSDDDDENVCSEIDLPNQIIIPDDLTTEDEISDYISDITGFCHFGFVIKELKYKFTQYKLKSDYDK